MSSLRLTETSATAGVNHGSWVECNYGSIVNNFNTSSKGAPEQRQRPQPCITIPFRRDPDFVVRDVLDTIYQRGLQPAGQAALVGLGGVGKSQIAIEYAYRIRDNNPDFWVFWVHTSSIARFEQSYRRIAEILELPGGCENKTDTLTKVYNWLSNEKNGRWTMILDNADDATVLFGPENGSSDADQDHVPLSEYIPQSRNGSIIVTSRTLDVACRLIGQHSDIFHIGPMEGQVALSLLCKKLDLINAEDINDDVHQLVRQLDFMPLAITQAAAYVKRRMPRMTISNYVVLFAQDDDNQLKLLQQDLGDPRRDTRASNSIIKTWHMSLNYIQRTKKSAARLLALMSLFDRESIPVNLLADAYLDITGSVLDFEEDIELLASFFLVGNGTTGQAFNMHRLVQISTQKWLNSGTEFESILGLYVDILSKAFPNKINLENWSGCQSLLPHVEKLMKYLQPSSDSHQLKRAATLSRCADYATVSGHVVAGELMARHSLEVLREMLGPDDLKTLEASNTLVSVLNMQLKVYEAESLARDNVDKLTELHGTGNLLLWDCMRNLAQSISRDRPNQHEAEWILKRIKSYGKQHPHLTPDPLLIYGTDLAIVLTQAGKYWEAEQMHKRIVRCMVRKFGPYHPRTLACVHNYACLLNYAGRKDYAAHLFHVAAENFAKALGPGHPDTLQSRECLDSILRRRQVDGSRLPVVKIKRRKRSRADSETSPSGSKRARLDGAVVAAVVVDTTASEETVTVDLTADCSIEA